MTEAREPRKWLEGASPETMPSRRSDPVLIEPTEAVSVRVFPGSESTGVGSFLFDRSERGSVAPAPERASAAVLAPPRGERPGVERFNRSDQRPGVFRGEANQPERRLPSDRRPGLSFFFVSGITGFDERGGLGFFGGGTSGF